MVHSSFWAANSFSATQEIPWILWHLNVHHHVHNSPPLVPTLSQINLHHIAGYKGIIYEYNCIPECE
jgi:hypothetical protein